MTHHGLLAGFVFSAGIMRLDARGLAVARPRPGGSAADGDEPVGEEPPPEPDGVPRFDWAAFEREFRAYDGRAGVCGHPSDDGLSPSSSACSRVSPESSG